MRVTTYEHYIRDLLQHPDILELHRAEAHHFRRSRFVHCYAVGKLAYRLAVLTHANVTVTARAGFLHDWYHETHPHFRRLIDPDTHHFRQSVEAAKNYGESPEVLSAIRTHMWPWGRKRPRSREAWIVWVADNLTYVVDAWQSLKLSTREHMHELVYGPS
ncbi:MAG: HD domain-containing protein [Candidatus Kerfeldbacteria bacterium]|nr:HD domain-containing protein [Candidatus Kerfeldbacteria bacterium]